VFDLVIGDFGLAATADPAAAVRELARVTKPLGAVVLIQFTWTRQIEPRQRAALVAHLGLRPQLLVEWKQMLRDAGVVELHVEDLSGGGPGGGVTGGSGLAAFGGFRDRLGVLRLAWRRWGWPGVRMLLHQDQDTRRLLSGERALGLSLIRGTRWHGLPEA
jgi:hypothetical protein